MKKLIFSILATLTLAACGGSGDDAYVDPNEYIDNSVIMGKWYKRRGPDSVVYNFKATTADFYAIDVYLHILSEFRSKGKYRITKDRVFFGGVRIGNAYRIVKDTLYIASGPDDTDLFGKYIRVKAS